MGPLFQPKRVFIYTDFLYSVEAKRILWSVIFFNCNLRYKPSNLPHTIAGKRIQSERMIHSQLVLAIMTSSSDPMKPMTVNSKQKQLNAWRRIQSLVQALTFFCLKYISMGRYMASGQKLSAPRMPSTELK